MVYNLKTMIYYNYKYTYTLYINNKNKYDDN